MTVLIVYLLIFLNAIMFVFGPLERLALIPSGIQKDGYSRLLTSMFGHVNWMHLIFNMAALHRFGIPLETVLGPWYFLAIYLISGVGSNILYTLTNHTSNIALIGASAGVSGIMAVYFLRFAQTRHMTNWLVYQIIGALLYKSSGISYSSHLYGFVVGALYYFLFDGEKSALRSTFV